MRLTGLRDEISTRTGWSSKRDATNNRLYIPHHLAHYNSGCWALRRTGCKDVVLRYIRELQTGLCVHENHLSDPTEYTSSPAMSSEDSDRL